MNPLCRELEHVFSQNIPLTHALSVQVKQWENHCLELHLPLDANKNHKNTIFGGSLYCAAVLAGWGWLHLRLQELGIDDGEVVVHAGEISYPAPANSDIKIICQAPSEMQWDKFINTYQRRHRARLNLKSQVFTSDGTLAAELNGQYVLYQVANQ